MEFPQHMVSESVVWADFSKTQIIMDFLKIDRKIINGNLKQFGLVSDSISAGQYMCVYCFNGFGAAVDCLVFVGLFSTNVERGNDCLVIID